MTDEQMIEWLGHLANISDPAPEKRLREIAARLRELADKRPAPSLPPGTKVFSSVTAMQPDGYQYCIDFLARDFTDAARLCKMMGLSTDDGELGEAKAIVEMTPDGPMTTWDADDDTALGEKA